MLRLCLIALLLTITLATETEEVEQIVERTIENNEQTETVDEIEEQTEEEQIEEREIPAEEPEDGADLEKKSVHYCYHNGHIIMNGRTQTDPYTCSSYRCRNGRVRKEQNQCEHRGRCIPEGRSFTEKCITYRCDRKRDRNNRIRFIVSSIASGCVDAHGNCRSPGDRFPHVQYGRYRSNCTCRKYKSGNQIRIKYQC